MTGRTHDLAAVTALGYVALAQTTASLTLATALLAILANMIGGIAPDIDEPTAPFWRNLPVGGIFGRIIDKMLGGHRFLTHSLLGLGLFGGLFLALLKFLKPVMGSANVGIIWWAFMIGMLSHLIMDTFTKEGVPWLLPIPIKFGLPPFKSLRITTGKAGESFVLFPGIVLLDIYYCWTHYSQLLNLLHHRII